METDIVSQKETLPDNEGEIDISKDTTNDTTDVTVEEKVVEVEVESTDKVDDSNDNVETMDGTSLAKDKEELEKQNKHKRVAAVRALEKIREWTRNLMIYLP